MHFLRSQTRVLSIFFLTWTLMQIVFLLVFWKEGSDKCQESSEFKEVKKLITALRKEIGFFRKIVATKQYATYPLHQQLFSDIPTIFLITPTYARPTQKADLIRMSQTLLLVPNIHWIVVEDSDAKTDLVSKLLFESGIPYTQLNIRTPKYLQQNSKEPRWKKPRGVAQRNLGLEWLRENINDRNMKGVVYFADDDNTYHVQLFEEMRYTNGISTWPVAFSGELLVEKPYVKNGKIVGWNSIWNPSRPYPGDMAGFAINLSLILNNPTAKFKENSPVGYQESVIISQLINLSDLEPKADNCTKVLVWHTKTRPVNVAGEKLLKKKNLNPSNYNIEV